MSSLAPSSQVSPWILEYLVRWPVFRFSWLNDIFSDSEVAGYSATGQLTSERRRKPFQFARGAMNAVLQMRAARIQDERRTMVPTSSTPSSGRYFRVSAFRRTRHLFMLCSIRDMTDRPASWRKPTQKQMQ